MSFSGNRLIDAEHLRLSLNGASILTDVSLHLDRGEIYGLLGPNGAGKSTTIAVLLGLYPAGAGRMRLFGGKADGQALEARRRIGVMPERAGFYDWMDPTAYLAWFAGFYGGLQWPADELLSRVGLDTAKNTSIGQFSRGMRQRLSLARALAHGPELLILDEPTNGLDPRGRHEIHDLLLSLATERDVGILLCTHLLDDVDRLCNRIGIIDRGRTVLEGPLTESLATQDGGLRFRLRLRSSPRSMDLPEGLTLLGQDSGWWHLRVATGFSPALPSIWLGLMQRGWPITEIHSEGGGLEELYLALTGAKQNNPTEEVA